MPSVNRSHSYRPAPSLQEASAGRRFIELGHRGPAVEQLQTLLRERGYSITVDGFFGRETDRVVRAFQAAARARVDGIVGPETMGKLRAPSASSPSPDSSFRPPAASPVEVRPAVTDTERQRFELYASIVRRHGGEVNPGGLPTVLGMRAVAPGAGVSSSRLYDDTLVVLTREGRVHEFRGATHPAQRASSLSPDANRDGRGDVGMIRPGNYLAGPNGDHRGRPSFHVKTLNGSGRLPGWRDTNQDGRYSDAERAASERRGDTLSEVLFHRGTEDSPISIGCQTLPAGEYERFLRAVGGPSARFTYTLVDANA